MGILKANCRLCGAGYEYEAYGNIISFCKKCRKLDFVECEAGFGAVTPCVVYLGGEEIGKVICENRKYYLISERFGLDMKLEKEYTEALSEAAKIIAEKLSG